MNATKLYFMTIMITKKGLWIAHGIHKCIKNFCPRPALFSIILLCEFHKFKVSSGEGVEPPLDPHMGLLDFRNCESHINLLYQKILKLKLL